MINDVNTEFATERSRQLDDARNRMADIQQRVREGRLKALGNDRFRVTDPGNWDNGEIVSLRSGQLVAEHGLDMTTGRAALYTAVPAWHGLGAVIPGGTESIDEVLTLARIDWEVRKIQPTYVWEDEERAVEDTWFTVREDTGAKLGVVGSQYTPIQQRPIFEFLEELVGEHDVIWESAGALDGGKRVFVSLRLPAGIVIDTEGFNDQIDMFVVASNSHDGRSGAEVLVTPWRPICSNTERFGVRDAVTRWSIRHTRGALDRIQEARNTLRMTQRYAMAFTAEENALARTEISLKQFHEVCRDLWQPVDQDADTRAKNNAASRAAALEDTFRTEAERVGRTAYAAERAITHYLDHVRPRRVPKSMTEELYRAQLAMEGTEDKLKTAAHRQLMELVRR